MLQHNFNLSRLKNAFDLRRFIASFLLISLFYLMQFATGWWPLLNSGIRGPYRFLDLKLVLKSFDCYAIVGDEVFAPPTTDPCNGYIYGRQFFFLMTKLKVGESYSNGIALVLALSFVTIAAGLISTRESTNKSTLLGIFVFLSPSCWLLIERMNLDLLIFLLFALAILAIRLNKPSSAVMFILISALIKFYTFPLAFVCLLFMRKGAAKKLITVLIFITGLLLISEIAKIPRFPGTWYVSFGNQIIGQWWNLLISERKLIWPQVNSLTSTIAGIISVAICLLIFKKLLGNSISRVTLDLHKKLLQRELNSLIYMFSSALIIICYFAGMNYDYRLFFIGLATLMIYILNPLETALVRILVVTTIGSLWMSCYFYGLQGIRVVALELAGDLFTGVAVSLHILILIKLFLEFKQERFI